METFRVGQLIIEDWSLVQVIETRTPRTGERTFVFRCRDGYQVVTRDPDIIDDYFRKQTDDEKFEN